MKTARLAAVLAAVLSLLTLFAFPASADEPRTTTPIRHFVYLMQGDRTFDNYFGTFPGADGIPAGTCQPKSLSGPPSDCVRPFDLHGTVPNQLSPSRALIAAQVAGGRMDGFVSAYTQQGRDGTQVMGHYDQRDLPFSWAAAQDNVLFDRFFAAVPSGTGAERLYWVAAANPMGDRDVVPAAGYGDQPTIFDRLNQAGVSWKFYVEGYKADDTFRAAGGSTQPLRAPLLGYARFVDDPAMRSHIVDLSQYYRDLDDGNLPAVSYIASFGSAERSAHAIPAGQKLIRGVATQLMLSSYWRSSALLWSYDGSGGWYDHVVPPQASDGPRGLRVPAVLVDAALAGVRADQDGRQGSVDHTVLDSTSALRFVEDNWALQPLTGRDANAASIAGAFDFSQGPREPKVLSATEPPGVRPIHAATVRWLYGGAGAAVVAVIAVAAVRSARRSTPSEGTRT